MIVSHMIMRREWHRRRSHTRKTEVNNTVGERHNVELRNKHVVVLDGVDERLFSDCGTTEHGCYEQVLHKQLVSLLHNNRLHHLVYLSVERIERSCKIFDRTVLGELSDTLAEAHQEPVPALAVHLTPVGSVHTEAVLRVCTQRLQLPVQRIYRLTTTSFHSSFSLCFSLIVTSPRVFLTLPPCR